MRSGTHLVIDLVLNNFAAYRRTPLYVDLDRYFRRTDPVPEFTGVGSSVIKTHFPQITAADEATVRIRELARSAILVQPVRALPAVYSSLQRFGYRGSREDLAREAERFDAFWAPFGPLKLSFEDLADTERSLFCLRQIAQKAQLAMPPSPIASLPKQNSWAILCYKAITRMLGRRAPRVNTSIQLTMDSRD